MLSDFINNQMTGMKNIILFCTLSLVMLLFVKQQSIKAQTTQAVKNRPNILFAIADDQSYPHASAYGQASFQTPVFDRIVASGILFFNAFVAAPQCSPSRAAILTGRNIWQLEEAGTHASHFPKKFPVFTDALENAGYFIGYTGKGWDPGNFKDAGWSRNPVGPDYSKRELDIVPASGITRNDYAANFADFLSERPAGKPFFFWFGSYEPHRDYEPGSGAAAGLNAKDITVPQFLPDNVLVRNDLLDYALEINWFDLQLGKMIQLLEASGQLENTIIVVTADNGMPFPYAKANLQEYGTHVPLAICGPGIKGNHRKVDDLVSLIDLAPTFLDIAGVNHFKGITGKTLLPIFNSTKSGSIDPSRKVVLTGRERHTHARPDNVGYPARAIRTPDFLYIKNFKPGRWPVGDPPPGNQLSITGNPGMKPKLQGYEDIDGSPTKSFMVDNHTAFPGLFQIGFEKRGGDELYYIKMDPYCLHDLAGSPEYKKVLGKLRSDLQKKLAAQGDPRVLGKGDIFDSYPRFGPMRSFEGFKERGKYNPAFIKD